MDSNICSTVSPYTARVKQTHYLAYNFTLLKAL